MTIPDELIDWQAHERSDESIFARVPMIALLALAVWAVIVGAWMLIR